MAALYEDVMISLRARPRRWIITGVAGFIGSHLLEHLLLNQQFVIGVDNFITGSHQNLKTVQATVGATAWSRFHFVDADLSLSDQPARSVWEQHLKEGDIILHQAALGSVPRSIEDPATTVRHNINGFVQIVDAAVRAKVSRFVYASSSSVYGDDTNSPKCEERIGRVLSPYAATKAFNEMYADLIVRLHGLEAIGLRYFNVFGARQDPAGPYAAVIPRWIAAMSAGEPCFIFGDGLTSRDFCYVENVVQANILAGVCAQPTAQVFNIAVGKATTLNQLHQLLRDAVAKKSTTKITAPTYAPARAGDIQHSLADITRATKQLGYVPSVTIEQGIELVTQASRLAS